MIHFPILQIQHGGTAGPPLWLFCAPTFLSLPCQLPPRLLASTQAGYVRPVYTTSSSCLFIFLPPFQPDTFVSDKAISVLFWGLRWRTPPRPAGNHRDMFLGATTRLPDRRLRWKKTHTHISVRSQDSALEMSQTKCNQWQQQNTLIRLKRQEWNN